MRIGGGSGGGSGGDDGGGGGGGDSGGDSGGGGGVVWEQIAPDWLQNTGWLRNNAGLLESFATNPRNFIMGAVLTSIVEGIFGTVSTVLDAVLLALGGSRPFSYSPYEAQWGLADVPMIVANDLIQSGAATGESLLTAISAINDPLYAAAGTAGPFGPPLIALLIAAEVIATLWIFERVVRIVIDAIPGGGGLL